MPFTVAVIGASGLLGRAIARELAKEREWRIVPTAFRRVSPEMISLDICNAGEVMRFIDREAPHAIVIAAAERKPDVCELEPARAHAMNVVAVQNIAAAANRVNAWTLSISTDYVFDGTRPPYLADDPPCPLNAYGRSKLLGERALIDAAHAGCVLRLPLLYGPVTDWQESAVTSLVPSIIASTDTAPATMDAWAVRYPTYTPDVAFVIRQLLARHFHGKTVSGVTHWSGDQPMTKYDIAAHLAAALQVEACLIPQRAPTDSTPRPHDCHLDSSNLEKLGIGRRTPFEIAIRDVLRQLL
ncbi:dTDP-4-dehydrorhamnose reductase family protein [Paraburkholderia sp.]|uniref:dTDP-4-dehydrorhamnose reductase family protein n=1 Tax=Paraburkholderia sp. TaxID=1926495 RepID=UPI003D6FBBEB